MGKEKKRSVKASRKAQIKAMRLKGQESLRRKREEMANYKAQKSAFSEIDEDQPGARRDQKIGNKSYVDQGSDKKVTSSGKSTSGLRISGSSESRPSTPVNCK